MRELCCPAAWERGHLANALSAKFSNLTLVDMSWPVLGFNETRFSHLSFVFPL